MICRTNVIHEIRRRTNILQAGVLKESQEIYSLDRTNQGDSSFTV